jgi:hypothetical protein
MVELILQLHLIFLVTQSFVTLAWAVKRIAKLGIMKIAAVSG